MRASVAALLLMALFPRPGSAGAGLADPVFGDGFEPPCFGTANDRPGCIVVPFNLPPLTASLRLSEDARWSRVDVYTLFDRSGSMTGELTALRANLSARIMDLTCPPSGTGDPAQCIGDLWAGAGTFAYSTSGVDAYRNFVDLQPNPNFSALPITDPGGGSAETTLIALYSAISGLGGTICGLGAPPARTSCDGSPAANAGASAFGYGCFRSDAASVVVVFTDEPPSAGLNCPVWNPLVRNLYLSRGVHVIGVYGDGSTTATINELNLIANDTGSIDITNGAAPLVFAGSGANAPIAFSAAMQAFRAGVPMDLDARVIDGAGDAVDVGAFVQRIEVVNDGSVACPNGAVVIDRSGDGIPDTFLGIVPGTRVCFRLVTAPNSTVPSGGQIQFYPGKLRLQADGRIPIVEIPLTFAVPP